MTTLGLDRFPGARGTLVRVGGASGVVGDVDRLQLHVERRLTEVSRAASPF